ncbi:MAG: dihydroorotase [Cohaesibacteraceae bacterium]|nr:dihydroorotase [Cohaesibacteraceae bacterium]
MTFDTILTGGTVVSQHGRIQTDIGILNGRIVSLEKLDLSSAPDVVDCKGLHILPGVIDTQVHFREPGLEHKEDLESGSRAAVMGGVTGVFEMPNTNPLTISESALKAKLKAAEGRMHCDHAFYIGGTRDNVDQLARLERLPGCCGIKVFMGSSTGNLLVDDDESVRAILSAISRRAAFHSEDEPRLIDRNSCQVAGDPASHPVWRDVEVALKCTKRLIKIAREVGARIHVLHISTGEEMKFLAAHKDVATVEATPHHLTLAQDAYARLGTLVQMNPPVRNSEHRAAIWAGIENGVVDVLGSDHAPHTLDEKQKPYPESPSGMTGVQTLVPIMLDHVSKGNLTLERMVDLTSSGPNRLFQIANKGRIAVGYDADFTIVDLERQETITNDWIASKSRWTPYDGVTVQGWPVGTFIRGMKVMWNGNLVKASSGKPMRFLETLAG